MMNPPSRSNSRYGKQEQFQHQQRKDQNQNHVSSLLPIQKHEREILYLLERHQVVIIIGQTGCGKTTQICQYLRKAKWTIPGEKMVCVTQPRRASAQTVAMRVCEEIFASNSSSSSQRCCLGGTVGVSVRFETMKSSETEIRRYSTQECLQLHPLNISLFLDSLQMIQNHFCY